MISEDWGLIEYGAAAARQLALVDEVAAGRADERIVFCSHPPVVTLGRGTPEGDLAGWTGATVETSRGGRATYHGPNQLVIYPILNLKTARPGIPARDVHAYLRALETATVATLSEAGLTGAEARVTKLGELSLTGVWTGDRKIASIGIAVRKWITYHGVAINVTADPAAFGGIRPCGFNRGVMTDAESALGHRVSQDGFRSIARHHFERAFRISAGARTQLQGVP